MTMLPSEPLLRDMTPFFKLLILVLIILISALFTMMIGILVLVPFYGTDILEKFSAAASLSTPDGIALLKFMQVINQFGIFILPAFFYAFLEKRKIAAFLSLDKPPMLPSLILTVILIFAILPFTHWLLEVNQSLHLPEFLSAIETWIKNSEDAAEKLTEAFLETTTLPGLFTNIMIVGVFAAVGEELLFRGVLVNLLRSWFKDVHAAVFVSAVLFSAFHLQFFGFLPRLMLGLLFGYLFVWSGSLWLPILAHFLNNASAVVIYFMFNKGAISTDAEQFGATDDLLILIMTLLFSIVLSGGIYLGEKHKAQSSEETNITLSD